MKVVADPPAGGNRCAGGRYGYLRDSLVIVLLGAFTFLIYSNTFNSPFVFDDWRSIEDNAHIRLTDFSVASIRDVFRESPLYLRPVANVSFALNYYFHQYRLPGYHFVNILIHLSVGVLLFFFVRALFATPALGGRYRSSFMPAFVTALVWVVHPLHVQSVTYLVQRMNSLAAMFYLLSFLCYIKGRLASGPKMKRVLFSGSLAAGLMAFGSKEISITLPFLIVLSEWYFFQDLAGSWLKQKRYYIAGVMFAGVLLSLVYLSGNPLGAITGTYSIRDFSMVERVMTEWRVVVFYFTLLFFPHPSRLNLEHHFLVSSSVFNPPATLLSLLLLAVLVGMAVGLARKERLLSFSIFWCLGNLALESSFIGLEIAFEHRTYLPSLLVVLSAVIWLHRAIGSQWLKAFLVCGVVLTFSFWTYERNKVWQDEATLYFDCLEKSPDKLRVRASLGYALHRQGRLSEATFHLSEALKYPNIGPMEEIKIRNNLAQDLLARGLVDAAAREFARALRIKPDNAVVAANLGLVLAKQNKLEMAEHFFREAIRFDPGHAPAYNNLGVLLLNQQKYSEALDLFEEAVRLKPDFVEARKNIRIVLGEMGRTR